MPREPRRLSGRLQKRLLQLRRSQGLTQEQVAEAVGVSRQYYQDLEAGRKKGPSLALLEKLIAFFDLEPCQLFYEDPEIIRLARRLERRSAD